jgi:hypothetical protein
MNQIDKLTHPIGSLLASHRSNFPVEVLICITTRLSGQDIVNLTICGEKTLLWKLKSGGGVRSFVWKAKTFAEAKWPSVMSQLHGLKHFEFIVKDSAIGKAVRPEDMLSVPRTVTSLSLDFKNDLAAFDAALSLQPGHFDNLKRLHITGNDVYNSFTAKIGGKLPHGIEDLMLTLPIDQDDLYSDSNDTRLSITMLPPTITKLVININSFDPLTGSKLPSTLTFLDASCAQTKSDWIRILPDGLLVCHVYFLENEESTAYLDWNNLPRSLISFAVEIYPAKLKPHHVQALPPTLTRLRIKACNKIDAELFSLLPQSITLLETRSLPKITAKVAQSLPRSLVHLFQTTEAEAIPLLPRTLKSVKVQNYARDLVVGLPDGLTDLQLHHWPGSSFKDGSSSLTTGLKYITVDTSYFDGDMTEYFPRTLTALTIHPPVAETSLQSLSTLQLTRLTMLEQFSLNYTLTLSRKSSSWLPRSLNSLALGPITQDPEWFAELPPYIVDLSIRTSSITKEDMEDLTRACPCLKRLFLMIETSEPTALQCLLYLPSSLRDVTIELKSRGGPMKAYGGAPNSYVTNLPRKLRRLQIPGCTPIDQNCLPHLPLTLSHLWLGSTSPKWFTDRYRSEIPTSLVTRFRFVDLSDAVGLESQLGYEKRG